MAEEFGCSTSVANSNKTGKNKNKYKAFFVRADIEDCADAAKEYGVQVLPSILLIR